MSRRQDIAKRCAKVYLLHFDVANTFSRPVGKFYFTLGLGTTAKVTCYPVFEIVGNWGFWDSVMAQFVL